MSEANKYEVMEEQTKEEITIGNQVYSHIKTRGYTPVSIYKGGGEFLRIGPKELLVPELDLHKKLLSYGFPVPAINTQGEQEGKFYYTEQSLGDDLLGDVFWDDCKKEGKISEAHFSSLLSLSKQYAEAQLKTATEDKDEEGFYKGIHVDFIQEELPDIKSELMQAFEKISRQTAVLPDVLTHGDFNAYNLFEGGIIDFENIHNAPAGYDIVSNIYHTYNFPKSGNYELMRRYEFSPDQIKQYFEAMDEIYTKAGLPKLTNFTEDFIVAKTLWSTTRMQRYPKVQQWRYDRLKQMVGEYLSGKSIMHTTLEF